ncbi:MAG: AbrB/MazE/SpoVT family DNA-binding domain-containing protein [Bryobacteraceae bacterium]|nr:AbrB/MazE/SpoVT family DNA-binding domain-containing protein [Bryobacteraceae bacterium]
MATELKVRKIGSSLGVILPKSIIDKLRIEEGASLSATETPDGIQLSPYDPEFGAALDTFRRFRTRYRDALRELSK